MTRPPNVNPARGDDISKEEGHKNKYRCAEDKKHGIIDIEAWRLLMGIELLSPRSDFIFKLIFADNRNADILAAFLRSVLALGADAYDHLTIVDPHLKRETEGDKLGVLDVKLHTKSGTVIDIEIQVLDMPRMRERIAFYTSKMVTEQIGKGEDYAAIKKVISIVITDFVIIQDSEAYHNQYRLRDIKTGSEFSDIIEINTLELPKLPSVNDDTELWDWMTFFKLEREEDLKMLAQSGPQIQKAVGVLMELSQDERTRLLYEEREKARRDESARMRGAFERGINTVAKNLLQKKMPMDEIAEVTGLSREEIERLTKG
jgi:predicted transposase/invertase (TIGR01784 family)